MSASIKFQFAPARSHGIVEFVLVNTAELLRDLKFGYQVPAKRIEYVHFGCFLAMRVVARECDFFLNWGSTSKSQTAGKVFGEQGFPSAKEQPL